MLEIYRKNDYERIHFYETWNLLALSFTEQDTYMCLSGG